MPSMKFLFLFCNDCDAIAHFYKDLLGMTVTGGESEGYVNVACGIDLCFFKGDYPLETQKEWAWQPGYKSGSGHLISWSLEYQYDEFQELVQRIDSHSKTIKYLDSTQPVWRKDSYWAMTLQDPMGNTIELYSVPAQKPDSLIWTNK